MKHLLFVLMFVVVSAVPAYATEKESAYDRVIRTGTIRCGYGISPPTLVKDANTGVVSGLDVDVWNEIGKELGLKIEWAEEAGWGNFIEGLRGHRYDAFCSEMWADPGRAKFLSLSIPVLYSSLYVYARADDARFDLDIERVNAADVTIPAIEGDVSVAVSQSRFPQAKIAYLPQTATLSDLLLAIKSKKGDVMFFDQAMVVGFEKENPGVLKRASNTPAFVFPSYYGVQSGEVQLRDMINVALRVIIDSGRMERLARKYSDDYIAPQKNYKDNQK